MPQVTPPKPNPKFSRKDLKRIKQQGPSIEDLHVRRRVLIRCRCWWQALSAAAWRRSAPDAAHTAAALLSSRRLLRVRSRSYCPAAALQLHATDSSLPAPKGSAAASMLSCPAARPHPHPRCLAAWQAHFEVPVRGKDGKEGGTVTYDFVPADVLGQGAGYATEPRWSQLPQMSFMEFYQVGQRGALSRVPGAATRLVWLAVQSVTTGLVGLQARHLGPGLCKRCTGGLPGVLPPRMGAWGREANLAHCSLHLEAVGSLARSAPLPACHGHLPRGAAAPVHRLSMDGCQGRIKVLIASTCAAVHSCCCCCQAPAATLPAGVNPSLPACAGPAGAQLDQQALQAGCREVEPAVLPGEPGRLPAPGAAVAPHALTGSQRKPHSRGAGTPCRWRRAHQRPPPPCAGLWALPATLL